MRYYWYSLWERVCEDCPSDWNPAKTKPSWVVRKVYWTLGSLTLPIQIDKFQDFAFCCIRPLVQICFLVTAGKLYRNSRRAKSAPDKVHHWSIMWTKGLFWDAMPCFSRFGLISLTSTCCCETEKSRVLRWDPPPAVSKRGADTAVVMANFRGKIPSKKISSH